MNSHKITHINSKTTIKPTYLEIEKIRFNSILKKMATLYARLVNQKNFRNQTMFSARFDKQDENDQVLNDFVLSVV